MRNRRFPLLSVLVVVALAAGIGYLSFLDVDVPSRALQKVGQALGGFGQMLGGGGVPGDIQLFRPQQDTDDALLLVSAAHPLPAGYQAKDLVRMADYCDSALVTIKGSDIQGNRAAADALMEMLRAATADGLGDWQVSAGYRSLEEQQRLWDERVAAYRQQGMDEAAAQQATAQYVARPGASEHHTGLAFDMTVPGESFTLTEQSKWMAANCWTYGFILRYTADKQPITGINAEPWHIRYVGKEPAQKMRSTNQCLEEYLGQA